MVYQRVIRVLLDVEVLIALVEQVDDLLVCHEHAIFRWVHQVVQLVVLGLVAAVRLRLRLLHDLPR